MALSIEDATVKLTNGTQTVVVSNFNPRDRQGGTKMTFTPTQKAIDVPIGATIKTKSGQISGTYGLHDKGVC